MTNINIGDILTCCETGKQFTAQRDGCSVNYSTDRDGNIYSDEGVDIREKRALLDRSKPFGCYISGDGKRATGWKDNTLGTITWRKRTAIRSNWGSVESFNVSDVHGG